MLITSVKAYTSRLLPQNQFVRAVSILAGGTLTAQLLTIGATPILSRLYTPADFGLVALFVAISGILGTALTLRYETAILLPKQEDESVAVVLLCVTLALVLGALASIAAWLSPEDLKATIGIAELGVWLPIATIAAFAGAVVATGTMWLNRQRAYKKMAQIRITQSGVAVLTAIALGLTGLDTGLVVAQIVALLVVAAAIIFYMMPLLKQWEPHTLMLVARKHLSAPKFLLPTALLDVLTMQLPVLLITAWYSTEAAGQFSMAWRILALPMTLIGSAIGQVFFQHFSQTWPDIPAARKLLFKTWMTLGLIGLLPTILLMAFGGPIFSWVFGDLWRKSGTISSIIAPMLFAMLISSPTSSTFLVLGLQKYSLIFGIMVLVYRPLCLGVGYIADNFYLGLMLFVATEVIQIIFYQSLVMRKLKIRL